jgi:hypothetical protein
VEDLTMDANAAANSIVTLSPVLQWGFAGFSLVLVGVIVWLIKRLLAVLARNNTVISNLTSIIKISRSEVRQTRGSIAALRREMRARPCALIQAQRESQAVSKTDQTEALPR